MQSSYHSGNISGQRQCQLIQGELSDKGVKFMCLEEVGSKLGEQNLALWICEFPKLNT